MNTGIFWCFSFRDLPEKVPLPPPLNPHTRTHRRMVPPSERLCGGGVSRSCLAKIFKSWWRRCGLKRCCKWSMGLRKVVQKRRRTCQKRSRIQADMFNSVQKSPESRYRATRHIQFTLRSISVKYRFEGGANETSFRSLCKMAFFFGTKNVRLTWFL